MLRVMTRNPTISKFYIIPTCLSYRTATTGTRFSPHNFKILTYSPHGNFLICNPSYFFLVIGRNNASISITIVSNITVLVSHNAIIWFGYIKPMIHGVNKDSSQVPPTTSLPSAGFSPGMFVVLQEKLYQPCFGVIRLFTKDNALTNFLFQLITGWV